MKRIGGLFTLIPDRSNLARAAWAAAQGKRDRPEVREFFRNLEGNLSSLGRSLAAGSFRFSSYRSFAVRDTKSRTIHAPAFIDRVVHHAIIHVTGPAFERGALRHSYACRKGYGQHAALRQAATWTRRADHFGKIDVRKFYDSIRHDILLGLLERRFREQRLLDLFGHLLSSYGTEPAHGLPIGALTSQYLGNFMLDRFDHEMKGAGARRYLRYMDDVVVWGDRDELARLRDRARRSLESLGLEMKHGGEWNRCADGVPFLGFVVYPDRLRLGREGRKRLRRKFSALEKQRLADQVDEAEASQRATSLFAHARVSDDAVWRRTVLEFHHFGEAQEPQPRPARRLLEQHRQELPLGVSQQEQARQPQQEQRLPSVRVPRHGDAASPDDAPSCALPPAGRDETTGKTPPHPDTPRGAWRNGCGGAPTPPSPSHD